MRQHSCYVRILQQWKQVLDAIGQQRLHPLAAISFPCAYLHLKIEWLNNGLAGTASGCTLRVGGHDRDVENGREELAGGPGQDE